MSFFAQHVQQVLAASAASAQFDPTILTVNEQLLMQWIEHRRQLKELQSRAAKIEAKQEFLAQYQGFIDGVLSSDVPPASKDAEMFVDLMIWHLDCRALTGALALCGFALRHDLPVPDRYQRKLAVIIADEVADGALAAQAVTEIDTLHAYIDLLAPHDMPDEVRAKLHKAAGNNSPENSATALEHYQRAMVLDKNSGVKRKIEDIERAMKKASATDALEVTSATSPVDTPDASNATEPNPAPDVSPTDASAP